MRKLQYTLENGTVVNTLAEAKASGLSYRQTISDLPGEPIKRTPKRTELLICLR